MRTLDLRGLGGGRERGLHHGRTFAGEIQSVAELRIHLTQTISGFDRQGLLALADEHLEILRGYDAELCDELVGIAEGAGVTPAHVVVLNHYTDLRDLRPARTAGPVDYDGGCTMVWAQGPAGAMVGQTWDMHATATPYVMMLRVDDVAGGDAWLLSLTGCLGMAGLNRAGVALGINNLTSTDARVGVVWAAVVRKALREASAHAARDVVMMSPVGSGHHYLVADEHQAFGIETSGRLRKVVFDASRHKDYVHANHCLDDEVGACSRVPEHSTTFERQSWLRKSLDKAPLTSLVELWERLGSHEGYPRSVCTNMATAEHPHAAATCAGIAVDLRARFVWAVAGFTHAVAPERFDFTI